MNYSTHFYMISATYALAKQQLSDAEFTSNLEAEAEITSHTIEKKRKRKEKPVMLPGESDSSSAEEVDPLDLPTTSPSFFSTSPPQIHTQSLHQNNPLQLLLQPPSD